MKKTGIKTDNQNVYNPDRKLITMGVRLSRKERAVWEREAHAYGYEYVAEFVRCTIEQHIKLGGPSKNDISLILEKLDRLVNELNHIGNNINQLAKHANATGELKSKVKIALEELEDAVSSVYQMNARFNQTRFRKTGTSRKWKAKKKDETNNDTQD